MSELAPPPLPWEQGVGSQSEQGDAPRSPGLQSRATPPARMLLTPPPAPHPRNSTSPTRSECDGARDCCKTAHVRHDTCTHTVTSPSSSPPASHQHSPRTPTHPLRSVTAYLSRFPVAGRPICFPHRFVVAPMVGASDLAFRLLCRRHGADLCFTPMIYAARFETDPQYRRRAFRTVPSDRPLIAQFCGNDPAMLLRACARVAGYVDAVDLNLGCPKAEARDQRYGAYLLDRAWIHRVLLMVHVLACNLPVPVSCKIRLLLKGTLPPGVWSGEMDRDPGLPFARKVHDTTRTPSSHTATQLSSSHMTSDISTALSSPCTAVDTSIGQPSSCITTDDDGTTASPAHTTTSSHRSNHDSVLQSSVGVASVRERKRRRHHDSFRDVSIKETVQFARWLQDAGCSLLTVHGRVRDHPQRRRHGPANLDAVRAVAQAVRIPVLTNGNVRGFRDVMDNLDHTGAAGAMVAECVLTQPALFVRRYRYVEERLTDTYGPSAGCVQPSVPGGARSDGRAAVTATNTRTPTATTTHTHSRQMLAAPSRTDSATVNVRHSHHAAPSRTDSATVTHPSKRNMGSVTVARSVPSPRSSLAVVSSRPQAQAQQTPWLSPISPPQSRSQQQSRRSSDAHATVPNPSMPSNTPHLDRPPDPISLCAEYLELAERWATPFPWVLRHVNKMLRDCLRLYSGREQVLAAQSFAQLRAVLVEVRRRRSAGSHVDVSRFTTDKQRRRFRALIAAKRRRDGDC